jgi:hypothetical protein
MLALCASSLYEDGKRVKKNTKQERGALICFDYTTRITGRGRE